VGQTLLTIFPQMKQNGLMDLFLDAASGHVPVSITDFVYRNHEILNDDRCFDIQILPTKDVLVTTWRDVTERSRAARSLADAAALYRLLTENIVEVVVLLDQQERVIWVSPSLQPMTGWQEEQWRGRQFRDLFAAAEGTPEPVELHHWLVQSGPIRQGRLRLADPKGGWSWVQLSVRQLQRDGLRSIDALETLSPDQDDPLGQTMPPLDEGYVLTLQPVDEQVQEERRLLRRASTDALTGLESRATILGWLDQRLLDASGRKAQPLALLFCDFDDFKAINDTHGHACGDVVLKTVAERITRVIRHRDHAGRLGGDEFLVLLDGIHSLDDAQGVAAKLHALLCEPISWGDQLIPVSVSIGVALHGAGEDADLFLKRADRQMYAAKAAGRGRVAAL
jgi:diguanylate cyclase (GGDEF)-like protein/PAS domain S-box-containing protein